MIPRKIHYCWFGGNPLPELAQKCIASWKKYCPDFEIVEWNESNFDVNCCDYVREAYEAKKWAFVSDYARFQILYEHGGVYFDTDVELLKPIDDLIANGGFMGVEAEKETVHMVNPGLGLACEAGFPLFGEFLEAYHTRHFRLEDGTLNLKTIVEYTTEILEAHGMQPSADIQEVAGVYIYPKEYFNPCDMASGRIRTTEKTVSIHHYAASWVDKGSRFRGKVYQFLNRLGGKDFADRMRKIFGRKKEK